MKTFYGLAGRAASGLTSIRMGQSPGPKPLPTQNHTIKPVAPTAQRPQTRYLMLLTWALTLFGFLRVVSYLPTLWAVYERQNSSQHSLLTWCIWLGSNFTMAAWIYEQNNRHLNAATVVNLVSTVMCAACLALIVWFRH